MDVLVLDRDHVRSLLPMPACIELIEDALIALARGDGVQPLRSAMRLPDERGLLGVMPAYLARCGPDDALAIKVVTIFPGNHGTELDAHQGAVLLFDGQRGSLRAVIDAGEVTAIRTGAASGLATRVLARPDASALAIIGSGVQARAHLEAMLAVREIRRVRAWSPDGERLARFCAWARERIERLPGGASVTVEAAPSAADAVRDADIVCTTTSARTPVLEGAWLAPGAHVNAAGACMAGARELDTEAIRRARVFCDRMESARTEAGDLIIPVAEGAITWDHVAGELGDVLTGAAEGRRSAVEITVFESLGIGAYDAAAAAFLDREARARGAGTLLPFGGERDT